MKKTLLGTKKIWTLAIIPLVFLSFKAYDLFEPGLDSIVAIDPYVNNNLPSLEPSTEIELQAIHTNIVWESPQVALPFPNTDRLLVVEMDGRFFTLPDNDNASEADKTLIMDIQDRCWYYGWGSNVNNKHGGFQNAIFHPNFGNNTGDDYIYVYYLYHPTGDDSTTGSGQQYYNRLSRFTWTGTSFDPDSELIMINQYDTAAGHDGGGLVFDNDGFLYVSVGDEGSQNAAASAHTQLLDDRFRSGVWRLDVDMQGGNISHPIERQLNNDNVPDGSDASYTQGYYVPNDNPWVTGTGEFLEEFYAIGLRQPFRMTYDPLTENIWIGDVGGGQVEEIDILDEPGLNFQWNYKEGFEEGFRDKPSPFFGEEREPALDYGRDEGRAVIGGYIYRGSDIPSLYGKYIYGDNGSGNVWTVTHNGGNSVSDPEILGNVGGSVFNGISSFGLTHDNELMILKLSSAGTSGEGQIFKIVQGGSGGEQLPEFLSETGVFTDMQNLTTSPGIIPYETVNPLWSSGTEKFRWVSLPQDGNVDSAAEQIGYSEEGEWTFPVGTTFIKQFNNPNGTKLETRLWIHGEDGNWFGSTYKWRADGLEADILPDGDVETITIDGDTFDYEYPATNTCVQCHNSAAGWVLGFSTRQLNKDIVYPSTGRTANQLETLANLGFIPEVDTDNVATLVAIEDNNSPIETRVRSYFDSNCAYCHLPGNTRASFDLRFSTPFAQQGLINGEIIENLGIENGVAISPGNVYNSLIHHRINTVDVAEMMPPLAKGRIDTEAVQLIEAWINSLGADCEAEDALVIGNTSLTDGNFIDGHSPHVNINKTDSYTNTSNEAISVCINDFTFYARRVGNPVTPFIAKVNSENDFDVISIGQTRLANEYQIGSNTLNYSDHSSDAVVLQPGESIAPGYIDAYPDGSGSSAGSSLIPAITTGNNVDTVWQSYKQNAQTFPAIVMGSIPEGTSIVTDLARSYQFNIGISTSAVQEVEEPTITPTTNLAYLKTASQSSDYLTGGEAALAVDGNTNGVWTGGSVSHTADAGGTTNPWWRVDLEATYDISDINIFNRTDGSLGDRLIGAKLLVGNVDSDNPADYTEVNTLNADVEQNFSNLSVTGRYVMVYLEGDDKILSLAEVQVYGAEVEEPTTNLAYLKTASQSSDYLTGGEAALAVDGNTNGVWTGGSVSHTADAGGTTNPWWRVDLEATYDISDINIFNRTDVTLGNRLTGAKVLVGNVDSDNPADYTEVNTLNADVEQNFSNLSVTGRYVMVYLEGDDKILSLAEVQVYGELSTEEENSNTTFYQHNNYTGTAVTLNTGEYTDVSSVGITLNDISSIKIQSGHTAELYSEINFGGTKVILTEDTNKLSSINFNDMLASVKIYDEELELPTDNSDNIAYLKTAEQSTTNFGGVASRAVDGNTDGVYYNNSVTHTNGASANKWWRVDLEETYDISDINIFNRTDCCVDRLNGAIVLVGNTNSTNPADYTQVTSLTANTEQNFSNLNVTGRYVMVFIEGTTTALSLAEVQVFGEKVAEVPSGDPVATLYTNKFFAGNSTSLAVGDYPDISKEGIPLNDATSVQVTQGYTVELYPDVNFGGTPYVLTADADNLVALGFDDETESVRIFSNGTDNTDDCICASGESSLLVNGSFEDTSNPAYDSVFEMIEAIGKSNAAGNYLDRHPDTDFPGWFTTGGIALQQGGFSEGGTIEVGQDGFLGFESPDGSVFAELDGNHHNQLVSVTPGQLLDWELSHRGRLGVDVINISAGPVGNQTVIATQSSDNTAWVRHTGQYQVPDGVTEIQFTITPLSASNGDIDSSHLLDYVMVCPSNDSVISTNSTARNLVSSSKTTLYPNPASDYVNIFTNEDNINVEKLNIYDASGRVIETHDIDYELIQNNEFSISTSHLESAVYVIQLDFVDGTSESHNLVVKHE